METIGNRIKRLRKARDITQAALAKKIGVTGTTIHTWENDLTGLGAKNLFEIAKELMINPEYLLYGEDNKNGNINISIGEELPLCRIKQYNIQSYNENEEPERILVMDKSMFTDSDMAVDIDDKSMEPLCPKETKFFISLKKRPRIGNFVYAELPDGSKCIRQFTSVRPEGYKLVPLNSIYAEYDIKEESYKSVLGVVSHYVVPGP